MSFELMWRFEALKTAALEQLQYSETLNLEKLFERARQLYDKGYEFEMDKWHAKWQEAEKPEETTITETIVTKESEPLIETPVPEGYKKCPKCGEPVLEAWKEHKYKKNMTPCGHKWV